MLLKINNPLPFYILKIKKIKNISMLLKINNANAPLVMF